MENKIEHIRTVLDWLAIADPLEPVDVIFVFGGSVMEIAHKAVELFNKGYASRIVFNGNSGTFSNPDWKKPEADVFADYAIEQGIDPKHLVIQNASTNTLLDVQYGLEALEKNHIDILSAIIISRPVHQRRAYATFKKIIIPGVKILNQPCNEKFPEATNEPELLSLATRCVAEYDRLISYAEKGDIMKQDIPENVTLAVEALR